MNKEETQIIQACQQFDIVGEYKGYKVINSGLINSTYQVFFFRHGEMKDYIVQKVNTYVFTNPEQVMENISRVTEFRQSEAYCIMRRRKRGNIIPI